MHKHNDRNNPNPGRPDTERERQILIDSILAIYEELISGIGATSNDTKAHEAAIDLSLIPQESWSALEYCVVAIPQHWMPLLEDLPADPYTLPPDKRIAVTEFLDNLEEALEKIYGISSPWHLSRMNDYLPVTIFLLKEPIRLL